jgi:hypothetical protein
VILKDSEIRAMTESEAVTVVKEIVFKYAAILERLEIQGKISGNGYTFRQQLADFATTIVKENWIQK